MAADPVHGGGACCCTAGVCTGGSAGAELSGDEEADAEGAGGVEDGRSMDIPFLLSAAELVTPLGQHPAPKMSEEYRRPGVIQAEMSPRAKTADKEVIPARRQVHASRKGEYFLDP